MKFLKYFELRNSFRKVDLQSLYLSFKKYRGKNLNEFKEIVLKPLLLNKYISSNNGRFSGTVTEIDIYKNKEIEKNIEIYLWITPDNCVNSESQETIFISSYQTTPYYIFILNSEETEFEKDLEMYKTGKKYNL